MRYIRFLLFTRQYARCGFFIAFAFSCVFCHAQPPDAAEVKKIPEVVPMLAKIAENFFRDPDTVLKYSNLILSVANDEEHYTIVNFALQMAGECYHGAGDFPNALKMELRALRLSQAKNDRRSIAYNSSFIGYNYLQAGLYDKALEYFLPTLQFVNTPDDRIQYSFMSSNAAFCYIMKKEPDSARFFNLQSLRSFETIPEGGEQKKALRTLISDRFGNLSESVNQLDEAKQYYRNCLYYATRDTILITVGHAQASIARILGMQKQYDSALYYARNAIINSGPGAKDITAFEADTVISAIFNEMNRKDSAMHYRAAAMDLKDGMYGIDKLASVLQLTLDEQKRSQSLEAEKVQLRSRLRTSLVAVIGAAFLGFALIMLRNNRAKQKTNLQLKEQKENIEDALSKLKATQSQLVQSEKMASLGELTAGIAHEIQNPLNFVNNFSELNKELVAELNNEIQHGNLEAARTIANDIANNEGKINEHGKRADSIVKGMLQHSRANAGVKEPTDINALCDEYLRLCYHGLRAKDKAFNANLELQLDRTLTKVNIVPQDIGRVLLNVCNNAFYAVNEKRAKGSNGYSPEVMLATRKTSDGFEILVKDNGNGIPQKNIDKIFQPFFTTKPTGQGTGLGLSLSYDIVKAHRGEIEVNSIEGEGTTMVIRIPSLPSPIPL